MTSTTPAPTRHTPVHYKTQQVGGVRVFYREAGRSDAPAVLLLHGFPSSSHMFRNLIPELAHDFHVIAPDLPGFGSTEAPPRGEYAYTFDNLAQTIDGLTEALSLDRYAIYVFDYGAPVGFRLATAHPERITAIVSQNGNAYDEGLTEFWAPLRKLWADDTTENRDALRPFFEFDATRWQYTAGVPEQLRERISPDAPAHDQSILDRPGNAEIQLDLFKDYGTNPGLYPQWQEYLRAHQPPTLAIWGKGDPIFGPLGAEAFRRDLPEADIELIDTGHFALETHGAYLAERIRDFLGRAL